MSEQACPDCGSTDRGVAKLELGMTHTFHKDNRVFVGQDFAFFVGAPSDIEFTVATILTKGTVGLTAPGYGQIGNYGCGAIYVGLNELVCLHDFHRAPKTTEGAEEGVVKTTLTEVESAMLSCDYGVSVCHSVSAQRGVTYRCPAEPFCHGDKSTLDLFRSYIESLHASPLVLGNSEKGE